MNKKLIAALGLVLSLGLVGCGGGNDDPKDDPVGPDPEPLEGDNVFSEAMKNKFANEFKAGKFVVTCCGYEGMSQAQSWCAELTGLKAQDVEDVGDVGAGKFACSKLLDLDTIPSDYVVVLGVGYTGKGLSGTTKDKEIARSEAIAELDCKGIILVETAGAANRGTVADQLLTNILPSATAVIAKTSANTGDFFTNGCDECYVAATATSLKQGLVYLGCVAAE